MGIDEMARSQTLEGKVAIVSGSAKGIGASTCIELASRCVMSSMCKQDLWWLFRRQGGIKSEQR
jgi:hypothetical protein